ncbi:hypothetical protein [Okeania sp. KiyG1]|uniref:hypothetical protein n=1 Tax=Okeania sp. KiyG1 TaxID=2720165 RepID=UPI0019247024|nr:hypothetical protein [Okeania sp. KiyG1]
MVAVRSTFLAPKKKSPKTNLSVVSKKSARRQKLTDEKNLSDANYASEDSGDSQTIPEQNLAQVISLPKSKPLWLKSLMATQLTSSMVAVLLASTSVAIYGWTIYGQSKWTTEYQELQKLRQKERQISVANELLKNQIAEQASTSDTGLVSQNSVKRIFLDPAPPRPAPNPPKPYLESTSSHKYLLKTPVGY